MVQVSAFLFVFPDTWTLTPDSVSHPALSPNMKQKPCFLDRLGTITLSNNHGGRKRQVGLRAIVDEIIRILRVYLKSINKAISFMI